MSVTYEAIVVGAGPGGLSTTAALLDTGIKRILWIDRDFQGGRLNTLYREISSNTKTGIYLDAIHSSQTCNKIIESTPKPNAVTRLEQIDREETCELGLAGDVIMLLIEGMVGMGVEKCVGEVKSAELVDDQWTITLKSGRKETAPQLHLSTGSYPKRLDLHEKYNASIKILDLDQTMNLSSLPSLLPIEKQSKVGIIGNSHSGILACMNFWLIATSKQTQQRRDVEVVNFQRREILFAEYREDGIVWDNSGLKGRTANWAKEHMVKQNQVDGNDNDHNHNNDDNNNNDDKSDKDIIRQIRFDKSSQTEEEIYANHLPHLTHLIYAIGYSPSPLPKITINNKQVTQDQLEFDMHTSGFTTTTTKDGGNQKRERVHGLYGTGIAFPEEVQDPEGHVEAAVGLAKFLKFAERVKGEWGKVC